MINMDIHKIYNILVYILILWWFIVTSAISFKASRNRNSIHNERWHDLSINPKDLPKHADQVVVAYSEYDYDIGEYWPEEGWGNTPMPVVAWKYIEHFKMEEDDD